MQLSVFFPLNLHGGVHNVDTRIRTLQIFMQSHSRQHLEDKYDVCVTYGETCRLDFIKVSELEAIEFSSKLS